MHKPQKRLVGALVTLASLTALGVILAPSAEAASVSTSTTVVGASLKGGPGHPATVYAGTHKIGGKTGFCIDFGAGTPNSTTVSVLTGSVKGVSAVNTAYIKYIVNKDSSTTSKHTAEVAQLAIWDIQHTTKFKQWWSWAKSHKVVSASLQKEVAALITESKTHGTYKASMSIGVGAVGQTETATVTVRGSNGKPAAGLKLSSIKISSNARVVSHGSTTNSKGQIAVKYQRTNNGAGTLTVVLSGPSAHKVYLTAPTSSDRQRLLLGGLTEGVTASGKYTQAPSAPAISSVCATDCSGIATVTVSTSNKYTGAWVLREFVSVNGTLKAHFDVAAGKSGSTHLSVADGGVVTTAFCYVKKSSDTTCATTTVANKGSFTVVCPPWVTVTSLNCPCGGTGEVGVTAPKTSIRYYTATVTVNGKVLATASLTNGTEKQFTLTGVQPTDPIKVSFTAYTDAAHTHAIMSHNILTLSFS